MIAKHTLDVVHTFSLWELHSSFCNEPVFQRAKLNYKVVFINGKSLLVTQKVTHLHQGNSNGSFIEVSFVTQVSL